MDQKRCGRCIKVMARVRVAKEEEEEKEEFATDAGVQTISSRIALKVRARAVKAAKVEDFKEDSSRTRKEDSKEDFSRTRQEVSRDGPANLEEKAEEEKGPGEAVTRVADRILQISALVEFLKARFESSQLSTK